MRWLARTAKFQRATTVSYPCSKAIWSATIGRTNVRLRVDRKICRARRGKSPRKNKRSIIERKAEKESQKRPSDRLQKSEKRTRWPRSITGTNAQQLSENVMSSGRLNDEAPRAEITPSARVGLLPSALHFRGWTSLPWGLPELRHALRCSNSWPCDCRRR
jgi:hypothetical protein